MKSREWLFTCFSALLAITALVATANAQVLRITDVRFGAQKSLLLSYTSDTNSYFVLQQGNSVTNISTPNQLTLGTNGDAQFMIPATASAASFYRLRKVPVSQPLDTDGDGLDDVYELRNSQFLNPLDASDGLATISSSSPLNGEEDVAVTRETIVNFSRPLAPGVLLTTNHFYAGFSGRRLLSRIELSSDRRKATLFYLEPLPGGTFISVVFNGTGLTDILGRAIDADGDRQPGGTALIGFQTLSLAPLTNTAVIGRVFASEQVPGTNATNFINRPLAGVTITVDGMEETLRTRTDASGNFKLEPVPPGKFFVHIDGRTVTNLAEGVRYPDMSYYPFVGKEWEAIAGRTDILAGGNGQVFLPLIVQGTLQTVSMANDTVISFPAAVLQKNPELAGVSVTVPANALFSDNGTRGGKVGIAPVPPDRLPGPLPPGLELPLVITVQTDGPLNFDRPAPICFPNLPDPILGVPLPAGSKQALISFNHDKGIWEAVGSMTVSADGKFVCTDPGVGILQPGWHGVGPQPNNPPPPPPTCPQSPKRLGDLTGKSAKAGPTCKPPPCKPDTERLQLCYDTCNFKAAECNLNAGIIYLTSSDFCETVRRLAGDAKGDKCQTRAAELFLARQKACANQLLNCLNDCTTCNGVPLPPEAAFKEAFSKSLSGTKAASIEDQINQLVLSASSLLEPYLNSDADIPDDIIRQLVELIARADALAGGNAAAFLTQIVIESERQRAALEEVVNLNWGNAPAYPVLYVAEISRGTNSLFLRGHTAGFGQYSLFVPRDGQLIDVAFYDPLTKEYGRIFPNYLPEARYRLPRFALGTLAADDPDSDHDGLPDVIEAVYGTDPNNRDSDGDGLPDGAEVDQGTNPLDGRPTQTGIIATAKTPGTAVDVCAVNDRAVTAEMDQGVSVFNIFNGMNPVLIAHLDTPGIAQRVACAGNLIAVTDGAAGLAVIDITDPPNARIIHQLNLGATAQAVATAGGIAYVGLTSGFVVAVDLASGTILESVDAGGAVHDLGIEGDLLYVLRGDQLRAYQFADGTLQFAGASAPLSYFAEGITGLRRLFVGGGVAYATSYPGYDTISVTNAAAMTRLGNATDGGPNSFKQIVLNGSGLGVAAVGVNPGAQSPPGQTHDIWLYDARNPQVTTAFLTVLPTPGITRAVSIYNGLAYAADGAEGLQVVNYLAYDNRGSNPAITLSASFLLNTATNGVAEEGKLARLTASVTDDVQVRNVEFYVDDVKVVTDGNFPFEHRFVTPLRSADKTNFTVRAKATDTGGNFTWTETVTVDLVPDATPPIVRRTLPAGNLVATFADTVFAFFSEPIDLGTLNAGTFHLTFAGPDNVLGTGDDVSAGGVISWRETLNAAVLSFPGPLQLGLYRGTVTTGITDAAGNPLQTQYNWSFWLLAGGPDGDDDDDGLLNTNEIARGTSPFFTDTDGDGWSDGVEVADGTDPLNPNSTPRTWFVGRPSLDVVLPSFDEIGTTGTGLTMGGPPVEVVFPAFDEIDATGGITIGRPLVELLFPGLDEVDSSSGVTIGRPPLEMVFPALDEIDSILTGITPGRPPVSIRYVP